MTAPSTDLREALATVEQWRTFITARRWGLVPDDAEHAVTLADEIYRLRAELASETGRRLELAIDMENGWAQQCNAMAAVVREVMALRDASASGMGTIYARTWTDAWKAVYPRLLDAADTFLATGFLPDIELEDSDHG